MEIIENLGAGGGGPKVFKDFHLVTCVVLYFVGKQGNQVECPLTWLLFSWLLFCSYEQTTNLKNCKGNDKIKTKIKETRYFQ